MVKQILQTKQKKKVGHLKTGNRFANQFRDEILKISKEVPLTAENVVAYAENKKSILHSYFDWDDSVAAVKWRLTQARNLINFIVEPAVENEPRTFSYEIVKTDNGRAYKHIKEILKNSDWRKQIISSALKELVYWKGKYAKYNEFVSIVSAIDRAEKKYGSKKK
jgi:hypothetical protein